MSLNVRVPRSRAACKIFLSSDLRCFYFSYISNIFFILDLLRKKPSSSPKMRPMIVATGKLTRNRAQQKKQSRYRVQEPVCSPYLLHIAQGSISPKMRVNVVEIKNPLISPSASASKIEIAEFVIAQPNNIVTRSQSPLALNGKSFLAISPSLASSSVSYGPLLISSNYCTSRPITPIFVPLQ